MSCLSVPLPFLIASPLQMDRLLILPVMVQVSAFLHDKLAGSNKSGILYISFINLFYLFVPLHSLKRITHSWNSVKTIFPPRQKKNGTGTGFKRNISTANRMKERLLQW
jgi:hypothetical protein